jgi:hypothetical protein
MSARSPKVVTFLLTGVLQTLPVGAYLHVKVGSMPAAAAGLVLLGLDDGPPEIPLSPGDIWRSCDGSPITKLSVMSPALGGALVLVLSNEDAVPFSGSGGGGGDARRILEGWWLPHQTGGAGGALTISGLGVNNGLFFDSFSATGVTGLVPQLTVRGLRCGQCRPLANGSSGAHLAVAWPWMRRVDELPLGAGGRKLGGRLGARIAAFNVAFDLLLDGVPSNKALGSGLQFVQGDGTIADLGGVVAGFGIVRDGVAGAAGWWRFVARAVDAGALTISRALPTPAGVDATEWIRVRLEVADADPVAGHDGQVNVYLNETPVLSFADMSLFPPSWNGGAGTRTGFDVILIDGSPQADALCFARGHWWLDSVIGGAE